MTQEREEKLLLFFCYGAVNQFTYPWYSHIHAHHTTPSQGNAIESEDCFIILLNSAARTQLLRVDLNSSVQSVSVIITRWRFSR